MAHAKLSPSAAVRWMTCPGSGVMSEGLPARRSVPAARGTVGHDIAARTLLHPNTDPQTCLGQTLWVGLDGDFVNPGSPESVKVVVDQALVDQVVSYTWSFMGYVVAVGPHNGGHWAVERAVPIGRYTGEKNATGTADGIVVAPRQLQVHDFKSGWHEVDPVENKQCMMYALGVLDTFSLIEDFEEVLIVIHQPEHGAPKEWLTTPERLREFGQEVMLAGEKVRLAEFTHETADPATWSGEFLNPSSDGCRYCPARATCPALKAQVDTAIAMEFDDLTVAKTIRGEDLSVAMEMVARVEVWCKAVRAETERRLLGRQEVPGWKLVTGRRGARKWASPEYVEAILADAIGEEAYEKQLISPAAAEKLLKKERPLTWEVVSDRITQANGKPSVAPESDKREPYTPGASVDEFEVLTEE